MAAHLLIRDGTPYWWMSPDIWVVPGSDPNGPPGSPIAGQPAYLWAHAQNTGNAPANGTRVDFYWANPAMQIVVGAATFIGSAFADLAPGAGQDVLCLVPWMPTIVNGGHECVLAVAHNASELTPLPDPLPAGFDFAPPSHDQIAQRNLSVLAAAAHAAPMAITVTAPPRADKAVRVHVERGGRLDEAQLARLGLEKLKPARRETVQAGLALEAMCGRGDRPTGKEEIELRVARGTSVGVFVSIHAPEPAEDEYQLVHIVERSGDRVIGGLTYVVVAPREGATS